MVTHFDRPTVGVGMVGYSFMGRTHSHAWRNVNAFFDLARAPTMVALAGRDRTAAIAAAQRLGWGVGLADWRTLIERDDVEIVDICTPGASHAEIAIAALAAGKHVLCEKPLANSVAEAEAMVAAAESAAAHGVRAMVGFNYRRVPAITLARELVAEGRLGEIRHVRAQYLQDWIVDPQHPMVWRLAKDEAGSGALGDIGAHIVDAAQFVTGQLLTGVSALTETFVRRRPLAGPTTAHGDVDVDDAALFIGRLSGGALASFEATRFATGRKNSLRIEVNGAAGSIAFDFEAMNELWFADRTEDTRTAGFRRILVTESEHPYAGAWWPPGHLLGYEHTFTHQAADLLTAMTEGIDPTPTFADGLQVQRVLAAVETSAQGDNGWVPIPTGRLAASLGGAR